MPVTAPGTGALFRTLAPPTKNPAEAEGTLNKTVPSNIQHEATPRLGPGYRCVLLYRAPLLRSGVTRDHEEEGLLAGKAHRAGAQAVGGGGAAHICPVHPVR